MCQGRALCRATFRPGYSPDSTYRRLSCIALQPAKSPAPGTIESLRTRSTREDSALPDNLPAETKMIFIANFHPPETYLKCWQLSRNEEVAFCIVIMRFQLWKIAVLWWIYRINVSFGEFFTQFLLSLQRQDTEQKGLGFPLTQIIFNP